MYIYGKNVINEVISSETKIKGAYIYKNFRDTSVISYLKSKNVSIKYLEKYELDKMVDGNHQGIVLAVSDYEYADIDEIIHDNGFLVILDHLEDPHNFGAIIRTCEAAGVDGIIIPRDRSVSVNSTVMKVSAGALSNMRVCMVTNIRSTMDYLKKKGYWIIGTDMQGDDYSKLDYKGNTCIVIGNEGSGMSDIVRKSCDFIASIPMSGSINSLNASVACGIVVFEASKNRRFNEI